MKALEISALVKTYANGHEALKGIDLSVEQGDFFALLGPNGAGKSTAIGIICSLVNASGGTVKIFGHDLQRQRNQCKMQIGMVPQPAGEPMNTCSYWSCGTNETHQRGKCPVV